MGTSYYFKYENYSKLIHFLNVIIYDRYQIKNNSIVLYVLDLDQNEQI